VERIEKGAFSGCTNLASAVIPSSTTYLGYEIFKNCSILSNIISFIQDPFAIDYTTFSGIHYTNATLYVPAGTADAYKATGGWKNFKNIEECGNIWTDTETNVCYMYWPDKAIAEVFVSPNVQGDIFIHDNINLNGKDYPVTDIVPAAFTGCTSLINITIPNSVTSIGSSAFYDCTGLTSINIPSNVSIIGSNAFSGCSGLTNVTINCKEVGDWFRNNKSINEIMLGENVTTIGSSAFSGCTGLINITIPNSVTSIGSSAFRGCI
jgi:hypothetical protein